MNDLLKFEMLTHSIYRAFDKINEVTECDHQKICLESVYKALPHKNSIIYYPITMMTVNNL